MNPSDARASPATCLACRSCGLGGSAAGRIELDCLRRQHSIGPFIADFACVATRLVIELDGSQHAHAEDADARRTAIMAADGWTVIRFWNARVLTDIDNVLREIIAHLPPE